MALASSVQCEITSVLIIVLKAVKLSVQKQEKDVVLWWSPQPDTMSLTRVLRGSSAHSGRFVYAGTWSMKAFCETASWSSSSNVDNDEDIIMLRCIHSSWRTGSESDRSHRD